MLTNIKAESLLSKTIYQEERDFIIEFHIQIPHSNFDDKKNFFQGLHDASIE